PPTSLQTGRFGARSPVEPGDFSNRRPHPPTRALSPVIPNNVRTVRLTAAAGTNLARASSRDRSSLRLPPPRQEFTTRRPSSSTRRRSVRLAPIAEDSRLQPPVGVWAVSQSQCAGPRSPGSHHSLGGPLPRQPANSTTARPATPELWSPGDAPWGRRRGLPAVSR